jgi:hypothetical protein
LFELARICQKAWSFGKKEIQENLKNAIDKPVQDVSELSNQEIQC